MGRLQRQQLPRQGRSQEYRPSRPCEELTYQIPPSLTIDLTEVKLPNAATTVRRLAFAVDVPDYVRTEMKVRAAHRGTSIQHVIMTGLLALGFEIRKADMVEDGRRGRGEHGTPG